MSLPTLGTETFNNRLNSKAWEKLYPNACEDFPLHNDLHRFIKDLEKWMQSVNETLIKQMQLIKTHNHPRSRA